MGIFFALCGGSANSAPGAEITGTKHVGTDGSRLIRLDFVYRDCYLPAKAAYDCIATLEEGVKGTPCTARYLTTSEGDSNSVFGYANAGGAKGSANSTSVGC